MRQHIIDSSLLDFSDFPKWNPKSQTMMVQEFGLGNIFNSIQEFARVSSGDNHVAEVLEIASGQAGSGQGGKSTISTISNRFLKRWSVGTTVFLLALTFRCCSEKSDDEQVRCQLVFLVTWHYWSHVNFMIDM